MARLHGSGFCSLTPGPTGLTPSLVVARGDPGSHNRRVFTFVQTTCGWEVGSWFAGGVPETGEASVGSYGYNAEGYSIDESLGLGWEAPAPNPTIILPVRESDVVCPSDMIAIGDAMLLPTVPGQPPPTPGVNGFDELNAMGTTDVFLTELGLLPRAGMIDYQTQRHGGRWNVLYCDGHVLGESTKQFLDPRSDAVLRSWYRDHVPHVDIFTAQWRH